MKTLILSLLAVCFVTSFVGCSTDNKSSTMSSAPMQSDSKDMKK